MIKYKVEKQNNEIVLIEQSNNEIEFPMTFSTDPNDKGLFESLIGKEINDNDIRLEEVFIGTEDDEIYQLIAKLK